MNDKNNSPASPKLSFAHSPSSSPPLLSSPANDSDVRPEDKEKVPLKSKIKNILTRFFKGRTPKQDLERRNILKDPAQAAEEQRRKLQTRKELQNRLSTRLSRSTLQHIGILEPEPQSPESAADYSNTTLSSTLSPHQKPMPWYYGTNMKRRLKRTASQIRQFKLKRGGGTGNNVSNCSSSEQTVQSSSRKSKKKRILRQAPAAGATLRGVRQRSVSMPDLHSYLQKAGVNMKETEKRDDNTQFGVALEHVALRSATVALPHQTQSVQVRVPCLVDECVQYLQTGERLKTEGLFRVSGDYANIDRLRAEWAATMQSTPGTVATSSVSASASTTSVSSSSSGPMTATAPSLLIQRCDNIHTVCGLLKAFLRELPEPVLTFERYSAFTHAVESAGLSVECTPSASICTVLTSNSPSVLPSNASSSSSPVATTPSTTAPTVPLDETLSTVANLISDLPTLHQHLLLYLMSFLLQVTLKSAFNRMDIRNVSLIFGSILLRPRTQEISFRALSDTTYQANVIAFLLQYWNELMSRVTVKPYPLAASTSIGADSVTTSALTSVTAPTSSSLSASHTPSPASLQRAHALSTPLLTLPKKIAKNSTVASGRSTPPPPTSSGTATSMVKTVFSPNNSNKTAVSPSNASSSSTAGSLLSVTYGAPSARPVGSTSSGSPPPPPPRSHSPSPSSSPSSSSQLTSSPPPPPPRSKRPAPTSQSSSVTAAVATPTATTTSSPLSTTKATMKTPKTRETPQTTASPPLLRAHSSVLPKRTVVAKVPGSPKVNVPNAATTSAPAPPKRPLPTPANYPKLSVSPPAPSVGRSEMPASELGSLTLRRGSEESGTRKPPGDVSPLPHRVAHSRSGPRPRSRSTSQLNISLQL